MTCSNLKTRKKIYRFRTDVCIEYFEDQALVLLSDSMHVREVNGPAALVLSCVNGVRTCVEIADCCKKQEKSDYIWTTELVEKFLKEMESHGIVMRTYYFSHLNTNEKMSDSLLIADPKVIFWQEENNRAHIFKPDENLQDEINLTGIELWRMLYSPVLFSDLVQGMRANYPELEEIRIAEDIKPFIDHFVAMGFIRKVEVIND